MVLLTWNSFISITFYIWKWIIWDFICTLNNNMFKPNWVYSDICITYKPRLQFLVYNKILIFVSFNKFYFSCITFTYLLMLMIHFFSIHRYTHMQFEKLLKYIQQRNKIYKKWYTKKTISRYKLVWYI